MKGTQHRVVVQSLANSGDGVGRINEKVVFIPFAFPGETLRIEITVDKKNYSKARILEILEPSVDRVTPRCEYFGACGGCDWQHLPYDKQLEWKKSQLHEVLTKIGEIEDLEAVEPVRPSPKIYNYRNRIQLHVDSKGPHYYRRGSKKPVYIDHCPIASVPINEWLLANNTQLKKRGGKVEIAETSSGSIDCYRVNTVGQSELGFRQVNSEQNQFITEQIIKLVKRHQVSTITDLYCGQGNWSLSIASEAPDVRCLGVDNNPTNITQAKKRALPNTRFILGDVSETIPQWGQDTDLIIIDPPRAGCDADTIDVLNSLSSRWLIYISCHPATMARDLKTLLSDHWKLESLQPVDMFPQTSHLECLAILQSTRRKDC